MRISTEHIIFKRSASHIYWHDDWHTNLSDRDIMVSKKTYTDLIKNAKEI